MDMPLGVRLECPNEDGGRSTIFVARLILAQGVPVEVLESAVDRLKAAYTIRSVAPITDEGRDACLILVASVRPGGPPPPHTKKVPHKLSSTPRAHVLWSPEDITRLREAYEMGGLEASYKAFGDRTTESVRGAIRFWVISQQPLTALQQHVLQQYPQHGIDGCLTKMSGRKSKNRRRDVERAILRLQKIGLLVESEC